MAGKVRHLWDGVAFSLYALEIGDEHDYWSFRATMAGDSKPTVLVNKRQPPRRKLT
ncbi:MAG: hypothetical protein KKA32_18290 [Actinobacteria bacterium]|nr:hypothetical protein [Actinomycetota bacterium]